MQVVRYSFIKIALMYITSYQYLNLHFVHINNISTKLHIFDQFWASK